MLNVASKIVTLVTMLSVIPVWMVITLMRLEINACNVQKDAVYAVARIVAS